LEHRCAHTQALSGRRPPKIEKTSKSFTPQFISSRPRVQLHRGSFQASDDVCLEDQLTWQDIIMALPGAGKVSRERRDSTVTSDDRSSSPPNAEDGQQASTAGIEHGVQESGNLDDEASSSYQSTQESQGISCDCDQTCQQLLSPATTCSQTQALHSRVVSQRGAVVTSRTLEPPVTKTTLSELDVNKIVHNPKLRHDINFDPELHFRPNLDGEKGRRKTQKANDFWNCMCTQLESFLTDPCSFDCEIGNREWCLPSTLRAIRGILETLVPQRDRPSVEDIFDVELLMQQFTKGVANLEKLAQWLSQLLKSHCAPMRDEWVDEMVNQLSTGDKTRDVRLLVGGMRTLLGVLEAMKLVCDQIYDPQNGHSRVNIDSRM